MIRKSRQYWQYRLDSDFAPELDSELILRGITGPPGGVSHRDSRVLRAKMRLLVVGPHHPEGDLVTPLDLTSCPCDQPSQRGLLNRGVHGTALTKSILLDFRSFSNQTASIIGKSRPSQSRGASDEATQRVLPDCQSTNHYYPKSNISNHVRHRAVQVPSGASMPTMRLCEHRQEVLPHGGVFLPPLQVLLEKPLVPWLNLLSARGRKLLLVPVHSLGHGPFRGRV